MINGKVRFQNKTFLITFSSVVVSFIYTLLGLFGITPGITQNTVTDANFALLNLFAAAGIILDPTTQGSSDSAQALTYQKPQEDDNHERN